MQEVSRNSTRVFVARLWLGSLALGGISLGCDSADATGGGGTGGTGTGGEAITASGGGPSTGGVAAVGGTTTAGGGAGVTSGGTAPTGGTAAQGGSVSAQGGTDTAQGGVPASGGSAPAQGGSASTGGSGGAAPGACRNSLDCVATNQICDPVSGQCVDCVGNNDCSSLQVCAGNVCRPPCSSDRDCTSLGLLCSLGAGYCVACNRHADCAAEQYCASGTCRNDLCAAGTTRCVENAVVVCSADGDSVLSRQDCGANTCTAADNAAGCGAGGAGGMGGGSGGQDGLGGQGGAGAQATGGSGGSPECLTTGGDYCATLPKFSGEQKVDGAGDEFCLIPPMHFTLDGGGSGSPVEVTVRAGWSESAVHAHVHVLDAKVIVDGESGRLWQGDNAQFFLAGTSNLTGEYSGTQDGGAIHVLVSPPASDQPKARATVLYEPSGATTSAAFTGQFAGRLIDGGYELEIRIPWANNASPRASGNRFGFHLLFGTDNDGNGLDAEAGLPNQSVSGENCGRPGCDDRVWCKPALE